MQKPLIGLTTTRFQRKTMPPAYGANGPYSKSIAAAGGSPVLIPSNLSEDDLVSILDRLDGILFTGGSDLDPQTYGNPYHMKVKGIDADRDRAEIFLVRKICSLKKPFLGICRGCQVINVALGGSLYEHLPEQYPSNILHDNHHLPRNYLAHPVTLEPTSQLAGIIGTNALRVNSLHHQGIHGLSNELEATGSAPDGLIEAIELPSHPWGLAVQWHPEELQEHPAMRQLFQSFVKSCNPDLMMKALYGRSI